MPGLVRAVHRYLGAPLYSQSDSAAVNTAIFRRARGHGREFYLIATNMSSSTIRARVQFDGVDLPSRVVVTDLYSRNRATVDRDQVCIELPAAAGTALKIQPAR